MLVMFAGCRMGPPSPAQGTGPAGSGPVVTIVAVTESAAAGAPLRFTVHAQPAPADDLTVRLVLDADACLQAAPLPSTITILAGEQEATLSLQTTDVEVGSDGCSVTVTIAHGDGYRVGDTATSASVMVAVPETDDPDPPQVPVQPAVTIAADTATVTEGSDVSFTLSATPPPASPLTVNLTWTQSGSFLAGARPSTATIPTTGTATVSASTDDDGTDEPDGSVTLTVDGGSGYAVGATSSATVAVDDNDTAGAGARQPQVTIAPVAAIVTEGTAVSFSLTATPAPASNLTVDLTWTEVGSFLTGARPSTVTIPTSGTATVSASTVDDSVDEPNGSVTLTVGSGSGYAVGATSSATVTVDDNDIPRVTVAADSPTITEGADASFTVTATPPPASDLTVNLTWTQSGSFLTGERPSAVTIPHSGTATVSASTDDDGTDEPDGSVTLTVGGGSGYAVGAPSSATVTVDDDDIPPQVTVTAPVGTVTEGTAVRFRLTATPAPASPLTVNLIWTEVGSFLKDTRWSTVTIPTTSGVTMFAATDDDNTTEPNGSVTLTVGSGNGYAVGAPSSATVTVNDNDMPRVTVAADSPTITEGTDASFTVTATPPPPSPLDLILGWVWGHSFTTGERPSTATIPTTGTLTLSVSTVDDHVDEPDGMVWLLVFILGTSAYADNSPVSAEVMIKDND